MRPLITTLLAGCLLTVAACGGSAMSPEAVKRANDAVSGNANGAAVSNAPVGSVPDGTLGPGSAATSGPGTSGNVQIPGSTGNSLTPGAPASNPGNVPANPPAGSNVKTASCAGFKNGPGMTNTTITIGNSADLSGPVPGLFTAPQTATQAYVAYFNATNPNGICGRKLVLKTYDSRTDAGADQQATQNICDGAFAGVGSMSAFDSGGAAAAQACGLPDIRATATTAARNNCSSCFGAQATGAHEYANSIGDFFVKNFHDASQKAAFLYLNAGAAAENGITQMAVETKRGMHFLYSSGIDVADFNYGPYVQQMKSKGVQYVQFIGGYQQALRLTQAMQDGGFKPTVTHFDQTTDDPGFLKSGGSSIEGVIVSLTYKPFFEPQPERTVYERWLQQVSPGAQPNAYGMFGWSASKLFVEQALALGGKLTRASLIANLTKIHAWTGGGMHGPMDVGGKHTASCVRFQKVKNGKFVPIGSNNYLCSGITKVR